jgi:hypothetical protein
MSVVQLMTLFQNLAPISRFRISLDQYHSLHEPNQTMACKAGVVVLNPPSQMVPLHAQDEETDTESRRQYIDTMKMKLCGH